ncbi:hypothetical protein NDU88_004236 [Pleurodeles waltl]|uniref:Uncharacterized protein n=1 Tax=Pleurodeles waltl TaxID=8319 RepID=A0AAV7TTL8_PLEWA|nr:hypothetical protein NDU88_004236 [Pleurodeles waltl]
MPRGLHYTSSAELGLCRAAEIHTLGDLYEDSKLIPFPILAAETAARGLITRGGKATSPATLTAWENSFVVWAGVEEVALCREDNMGLRKYRLAISCDTMLDKLREMKQSSNLGTTAATDA